MTVLSLVATVATVAWLAFVVLNYLLSGRYWLWQLADLLPPVAFVAVPSCLLVLAGLADTGRPWHIALAGAAGILGLPRSGLNRGRQSRTGRGEVAGVVRVLSWNTEHWYSDTDPERFYAFLKDQDCDVYLLQEYMAFADGPLPMDDSAALQHAFPGYHIACLGELLTLSRLPIEATSAVGLPAAAPGYAGWHEVFETVKVLRTDLRVGDGRITLYNVHIPVQYRWYDNPFRSGFYRELRARHHARRAQFQALEADIDALRGAFLVAGDFNSTGGMGEMRGLFQRSTSANQATPRWYPASWPAAGPSLWQLDWTFTSRLRVRSYQLVDPRGLSDHRAQEITLETAGAQP